MSKMHGVFVSESAGEYSYRFFWLGNRLSLEEFNEQLAATAATLKGEIDALAQGMDMGAHGKDADTLSGKMDERQRILELPICEPCKKVIRGS